MEKSSERMSNFWTVRFLKIESEQNFGFPHTPKEIGAPKGRLVASVDFHFLVNTWLLHYTRMWTSKPYRSFMCKSNFVLHDKGGIRYGQTKRRVWLEISRVIDNDVSARLPNITSASCDLDLWPPDPRGWLFTPLPRGKIYAYLHWNRFIRFRNIAFTSW